MKKERLEKILNKYFELYGMLSYYNGYDKKGELPDNPFIELIIDEIIKNKKKDGKD